MTTPYWQRKKHRKNSIVNTNILIIGGGFVGLSIAYWLKEMNPDINVAILERSFCGSGASGRNAGFLTKGSAAFYHGLFSVWGSEKASEIYNFASDSIDLLHRNILNSCSEIKYQKTFSSTLFRNEEQLLKLEKFNPEQLNFVFKTAKDLPLELRSSFLCSYESSSEYSVNPFNLLTVLKGITKSRGVKIFENNAAFEIIDENVLTETALFKADKIILALNGYSSEFHPAFKDLIFPRRAQMLAVKIDSPYKLSGLYYDPADKVYWRKVDENVIVIGGKRLLDEKGEVGVFEKNSPLIQHEIEKYLKDQLKINFKIISRWSGIMGFTKHELPIVDRLKTHRNVFVAAGFSGHGMGFGFKSGKEMAELLLGFKKETFFNQFLKVENFL